jgi:hypothetical protein
MKHLFRNILLLNLISFSSSNINSCVSVTYDPKIVFSYNLENIANSMIQKIANKAGVNLDHLPYELSFEYNNIKYSINQKLRQMMFDENRNYILRSEIKKQIHKMLDPFLDKVKNYNNVSWTSIVSSVINTIFPQPSAPFENEQPAPQIHRNYLNETCAICKNRFTYGDRVGILNCSDKHFFHEGCIKQWLTIQKNCPICQKTTGANGKDLIIAQIETAGDTQTTHPKTQTTNFPIIYSYEFDTKILELSTKELGYHGITTNNLPARVVSDFNEAIKKIKARFQTIMALENRNYVTQNEAETVIRDELKLIWDKLNYIGETCSICLENFKPGDKVGILNCNGAHFFHKDCIYVWLNTDARKSCPLCRQENLIVAQIHNVR